MPSEPLPTALALTIFGVLLGVSALLSRTLGRMGVPVVLLFLLIGMLAGSEGIGGIHFDNHHLAFRLGTVALALILFDGGLRTPMDIVKRNATPAALLATLGVMLTAALMAVAARLNGFTWTEGLLLGAVVSSTDAAAVFSVLRGSGLRLKRRVGATLELESGLNDPMAVILTLSLTQSMLRSEPLGLELLGAVVLEFVLGLGLGTGIGYAGRWLVRRLQPLIGGLFPVLTLSIACIAFGVPTLLHGSGFLAVYVAGLVLGNGPLPYRAPLLRIHDFIAWFCQVVMFLTLGLLVFPSQLLAVVGPGLAIAVFLTLVARPLAVLTCLLPLRYSLMEIAYVGWVGLRGAVPIILAVFPILAGLAIGQHIFNIVFFVVVVSALVQGSSVRWLTARMGLQSKGPPPPPTVLEITSVRPLQGEVCAFHVGRVSAVCGATIADLDLPLEASVMLIVRGEALIAPRGPTRLEDGDYLYMVCRTEDRALLKLLFGQEDEE